MREFPYRKWLKKSEVAEYLDCSERHIERMDAAGILHSIKIGRLRRYHPDYLEPGYLLRSTYGLG